MVGDWIGATFGLAITVRMAVCVVCMRAHTDHLVRASNLGLLAAGLGMALSPFWHEIDVAVDLLLAGSIAAYLYSDRRTIGACGMACSEDVADFLDWLDRHRRLLSFTLLAMTLLSALVLASVRA